MNKYKVRKIFPDSVKSELANVGFDKEYLPNALDKYYYNLIKIHSLKSPAANILKQTALSKGGDLAVSTGAIDCTKEFTDAILAVTDKQLNHIILTIKQQPYGLKTLAAELQNFLDRKYNPPQALILRDKTFHWGAKTYVMGILNITPDSFSDGGEYLSIDKALLAVKKMLENNADIIDIGGESTRPFSEAVNTQTQLERILPVIDEIRIQFPETIISVDTRDHIVAQTAIEHGADIINDISGLQYDSNMCKVAADNKVPVVIMHSLATPDIMQINPLYTNLMDEICNFLIDTINMAVDNNIEPEKIIVDPGIGFGKTVNHNIEIIQRISEIKSLGHPVLVGTSRKKFIGTLLGTDVDSREGGTAAANTFLISQGVDILRVHDVKFHSNIIKLTDSIVRSNVKPPQNAILPAIY